MLRLNEKMLVGLVCYFNSRGTFIVWFCLGFSSDLRSPGDVNVRHIWSYYFFLSLNLRPPKKCCHRRKKNREKCLSVSSVSIFTPFDRKTTQPSSHSATPPILLHLTYLIIIRLAQKLHVAANLEPTKQLNPLRTTAYAATWCCEGVEHNKTTL